MMQLGQAAGTAVALATRNRVALPDVSPAELRASLRDQHAEISWPRPPELTQYLRNEDA